MPVQVPPAAMGISAPGDLGAELLHQRKTVARSTVIPRSASRSATSRDESGNRQHQCTADRGAVPAGAREWARWPPRTAAIGEMPPPRGSRRGARGQMHAFDRLRYVHTSQNVGPEELSGTKPGKGPQIGRRPV